MKYESFVNAHGSTAYLLGFLARAVSNDYDRFNLTKIKIENSETGEGNLKGIATDGKRLHIVDPIEKDEAERFGLKPGLWDVILEEPGVTQVALLADEEAGKIKFPDYKKVLPKEGAAFTTTFCGIKTYGGKIINPAGDFADLCRFFRELPEPTGLNLNFLMDLGSQGEDWQVSWYSPGKPLLFECGNMTALIMPIHRDRGSGMEKCYSLNEEDWYTDFDFVRDELEGCAGKGESILGKPYYEADQEPVPIAELFEIDDLIDLLNEKAWDVCGECAEDYPNLPPEKKEELNKLILDFLDKNTRHYYKSVNIVEKKVEVLEGFEEGDL